MSRRRSIALMIVVIVIGGAIFAWQNAPRDTTSKATVGQAVSKFRQNLERRAARGEGIPGGPELGVYRYATRGGEELNATIVSASHDYGGVSTIAVTPVSCGIQERWQVLAGRWAESEICATASASRLESLRDSREFFGEVESGSYVCHGDETPKVSDLREGMTWTIACTSDDASVGNTTRMVGIERVEAAGRTFDAVHTKSDITLDGKVSGRGEQEEWRRRADGLLLRRTVATDASVDIVGGGTYGEHYSLTLLSTDPQR